MKKIIKFTFLIFILFCTAISAFALNNSQARHYVYRYWGLRIYKASLDIPQKCLYPECNFTLSLTYYMSFKGTDIAERSVEEILKQKRLSALQQENYLKTFTKIFPNVVDGDSLKGVMNNQKASFYHNGKFIGTISKHRVAQDFFNIWLSPKTSEPEMRTALLALDK